MRWKLRIAMLLILAVPAFSGFPLKQFDAVAVPGLTWSWVVYLFAVHLSVRLLMGMDQYGKITAVAALIMLPVVFSGASLSYLFWWISGGTQAEAYLFGARYLELAVSMLTVIPLSLAIVAGIPFAAFEHRLLHRSDGVTPMEKRLLMAMRVFNHIVFDVFPNILEVIREEGAPAQRYENCESSSYVQMLTAVVFKMIHIGVAGICAALQYIPLWAVEISQLPERKTKK
jgi:hypothetical protein